MTGVDDGRLAGYRCRRNPDLTPDAQGHVAAGGGGPRFVIQQHAASSMHWDFRLEVDGVLVSWAVPKGPSTDPREKRLAVRTEDHPLDYAGFEGAIPAGEYGAGAVIVWDAGRYDNLRASGSERVAMADALDEGLVEVRLHGRKLRGGYALIHAAPGGDDRNWLLVKRDDADADARRRPVSTEPESELSVEEVAAAAQDSGTGAGTDDG